MTPEAEDRTPTWRKLYGRLPLVPELVRALRRFSKTFARRTGIRNVRLRVWRRLLIRDLQRLNDVLADSPLAGRYWIQGGLLLGWAREGQIMLNDLADVDFGYRAEDREAFERTIPLLAAAGFRQVLEFRNADDTVTIDKFARAYTRYDFFPMWPHEGHLRLYTYDSVYHAHDKSWEYFEFVHQFPDQELAPFTFIGRTWYKHADHEAELDTNYGSWRVPDPGWTHRDSPGIIERRHCPDPERAPSRLER
jgi:hypothetical protein